MIAALFVHRGGAYYGLSDVDPWDEARDARQYPGPHPVVAHPPCSRWCRLAGRVEARWGHNRGEDGGCFASALESVRRWGGVLEHPAYSDAWPAFGLPVPSRHGGWQRGLCGGWACHVEQGRYGHPAKKATWLYAFGVALPELLWGSELDTKSRALVSWCGNHTKAGEKRPRVGKAAAAATPPAVSRGAAGHGPKRPLAPRCRMSLSHWTCLHCEGWGCRRCAPSVDAVPSAVDLRVEDLRRQVVTLQVALVEAQCAAAVAQREVAGLHAMHSETCAEAARIVGAQRRQHEAALQSLRARCADTARRTRSLYPHDREQEVLSVPLEVTE